MILKFPEDIKRGEGKFIQIPERRKKLSLDFSIQKFQVSI